MGKHLDPGPDHVQSETIQDGGTLVGYEEAGHGSMATDPLAGKPLRGIDWSAIFRVRPDLAPPGYRETVEAIRNEKLDA